MKFKKNTKLQLKENFSVLKNTLYADEIVTVVARDYLCNSYDIEADDGRYILDIPCKELEKNAEIVSDVQNHKNFKKISLFLVMICVPIFFFIAAKTNAQSNQKTYYQYTLPAFCQTIHRTPLNHR